MIREANARKEAETTAAPEAKAEAVAESAPKAKTAKAKRRTTKAANAGEVETTGSIAPPQRTARNEHRGKSYIKSLIRKHAIEKGVPVEFAEAVVMVESNFNPKARSPAGAVGLMQIIPSTARGLGYRGSAAGLYDLETNIHWGMTYLAGAYDRAGGDTCGAVLRYNAGHFATRMTRGVRAYCAKVNRYVASL
ncbi:transglycosylase SLT domain-containing protein [Methylobrevis sp. L22]|uniref:Transglycosylase SLT domain-containing protein n=2 Tax=Methylobrevis albus TaxID=2793297 RepID=A0A931I5E5_9HYPH|nr:transglycosylase SLT domain-containing protein [Methylobrevis albus]